MQNTQNLVVATYARKLAVMAYKVTEHFPRSEIFGITSQMRRAALSIGSNIAEGCGRSTKKQLIHSLDQANGEASELEYQCLVASDLKYGKPTAVDTLRDETERVKRMLSRLMIALQNSGPKKARGTLDRATSLSRTDKPTNPPTNRLTD